MTDKKIFSKFCPDTPEMFRCRFPMQAVTDREAITEKGFLPLPEKSVGC